MTDDAKRRALLLVAGEAGLRGGETIALEWGNVDLVAAALSVRRSWWRGQVGPPKSGRDRKVPLTKPLPASLKAARHLRSTFMTGVLLPNDNPLMRQPSRRPSGAAAS